MSEENAAPRMVATAAARRLTVPDAFEVRDVRRALLAEFVNGPPVVEIIEDPRATKGSRRERRKIGKTSYLGVASVAGQRLHRVISPEHQVLAQHDARIDATPLEFMADFPEGAILASVRPGTPYIWQLLSVAPPESPAARTMNVLGARPATEDECAALDEVYPDWREEVEALDQKLAEAAAEAAEAGPPVPPPLAMPAGMAIPKRGPRELRRRRKPA